MKKILSIFIMAICLFLLTSVPALAISLTMNAGSTDYATRYEFENNPNVVTVGVWSISDDGQAIWHYTAGTYSRTLLPFQVTEGQDIYIQFWNSDWNDGLAKIYTARFGDAAYTYLGSLETNSGGMQYALISGLTAGYYYLAVQASYGQYGDDLHLGHFGAKNAVPEPTSILLLGLGLMGVLAVRRKMQK